jgi:hypothetical protein
MKQKVLLILGAAFIAGAAMAQNKQLEPAPHQFVGPAVNKAIPVPRSIAEGTGTPYANQAARKYTGATPLSATVNEFIIGSTYYDLQTNASIRNGINNNGDGTISAVWTMAPDPAWTLRGTGYNYFDGSNWGPVPTARLEGVRTGWPSIGVTGTGKEVIVSHMTANPGIDYLSRPAKGTGAWAEDMTILGSGVNDTWPRLAVGGSNNQSVHVIQNGSGTALTALYGQIGPILYSRSTDDGVSYPGQDLRKVIPGLDSSFYFGFGGDSYHLDTQGDKIVVGASDFSTDVVIAKSLDNGNTWTTQVIYPFPIPFYDDATMITDTVPQDGIIDTITAGAGDIHVRFDNNGMVHAWFTVVRVIDDDPAGGLSFFPVTDGLYYWNESMGAQLPKLIAYAPDLNNDGIIYLPDASAVCPSDPFPFGLYRGGVTQMPTAGIDAANNLYLAYHTVDELSDTLAYFKIFKHTYIIKSEDGGNTWTLPEDALDPVYVTQPNDAPFLECVFPNMARLVDANIHMYYQRDFAPGHAVATAGTCDANNNAGLVSDIVYTSFAPGDVPKYTAIAENEKPKLFVTGNYPNPATETTTFSVRLEKVADLTVQVTDAMGKVVYSETRSQLAPGSHQVTLDVSSLASGVYAWSVQSGGQSVNRKMIVY